MAKLVTVDRRYELMGPSTAFVEVDAEGMPQSVQVTVFGQTRRLTVDEFLAGMLTLDDLRDVVVDLIPAAEEDDGDDVYDDAFQPFDSGPEE